MYSCSMYDALLRQTVLLYYSTILVNTVHVMAVACSEFKDTHAIHMYT